MSSFIYKMLNLKLRCVRCVPVQTGGENACASRVILDGGCIQDSLFSYFLPPEGRYFQLDA